MKSQFQQPFLYKKAFMYLQLQLVFKKILPNEIGGKAVSKCFENAILRIKILVEVEIVVKLEYF